MKTAISNGVRFPPIHSALGLSGVVARLYWVNKLVHFYRPAGSPPRAFGTCKQTCGVPTRVGWVPEQSALIMTQIPRIRQHERLNELRATFVEAEQRSTKPYEHGQATEIQED